MKRILVITVALVAAFASIAWAAPLTVRVNIPFSFHAGDADLPAGEYEIAAFPASNMMLRRLDGPDGAFVPVNRGMIPRHTPEYSISFNKYGTEIFLSAINSGEYKATVHKTKAERKLAGEELKGTLIAYLVR